MTVVESIRRVASPVADAVRELLARLFARAKEVPQLPANPAPVELAPVESAPVEKTARKKKRTQEPANPETFSALLEAIDDSFDTLRIPQIKGSWLDTKSVRAIHKLGVYVEQDWMLEAPAEPRIPVGMKLPAIASCFMINKKADTKERIHARFAFVIKQPSLPPNVEKVQGTPYQYGECYELTEKPGGGRLRSMWVWAWAVVRHDGSIVFPRERRKVVHQLRQKRRTWDADTRAKSFTGTSWQRATLIEDRDNVPPSEAERLMACTFRQIIMWWTAREEKWSVAVKKDGRRVTFAINPKNTAAYFADRNKTVTVGGKTKKIIHFVGEHRRSNGQVVRAHVRGLREFDWRGYHCAVTAPNLTGSVAGAGFDMMPVELEKREEGFIGIDQVAALVADAEERDMRKAA